MNTTPLSGHRVGHRDSLPIPLADVEDRLFALVVLAYRQRGGLVTGFEAAGLLREYVDQPISVLARWIVTRRVINFVWRSETWIPLFQFDLSDFSVRPDIQHVLSELTRALDDWELARWFALPNAWLRDASPLSVFSGDPTAVLHAARTDRFVATG